MSSSGHTTCPFPKMGPATKKRRLGAQQVEEIPFDFAARNEYLTGFHKRKLERKENARQTAIKMEKEERVKERKQVGSFANRSWSTKLLNEDAVSAEEEYLRKIRLGLEREGRIGGRFFF